MNLWGTGLLLDFIRAGELRNCSSGSNLHSQALGRAQNQSRTEDVTEYFKRGEASPEGFLKSVLTFQEVVATGRYHSDIFSMGRRPDRPGATWEIFPHTDELHTDLPRVVQGNVLWPRAGSSPAAILFLFVALSQYPENASSSSLSSGAAWWIPGGGNGRREVFHVRGAQYPHGRPEAHQRHPRRGAFAPLGFFVKR